MKDVYHMSKIVKYEQIFMRSMLFYCIVLTYVLGCHFLFQVENKFHKSTCTEVYYQIGVQSTESNMLTELLAQIIAEPCFTTLRTKQQLGYIIYSGVRKAHGVLGLRIILQSDRHPKYVEQQIDAFMHSMLVSGTILNISYIKNPRSSFSK